MRCTSYSMPFLAMCMIAYHSYLKAQPSHPLLLSAFHSDPGFACRRLVTDKTYASTVYTPRYFFVTSQMKKWFAKNPQATAKRKLARRQWLRKQWDEGKAKDPDFGAQTCLCYEALASLVARPLLGANA